MTADSIGFEMCAALDASPREGSRRRATARVAKAHYRRTFGRAVAVVYTGGTVAQSLKLVFAFGWEYMPFWVDWALILLGTYGSVGLILFAGQIAWRGTWEKVVHGLIAAHLLVSVVVHAWIVVVGSHDFFTIFPYEYSYFAVAYFGFFAWRSWTMKLLPPSGGPAT
jgi:hypothetical protein